MLRKGQGAIRSTSSSRHHKEVEKAAETACLGGLSSQQCAEQENLYDIPDFGDNLSQDPLSEVLDGTSRADISHAGADLDAKPSEEEEEALWEDLRNFMLIVLTIALGAIMEAIATAYIDWDLASAENGLGVFLAVPEDTMVQNTLPLCMIDIFSAYQADIPLVCRHNPPVHSKYSVPAHYVAPALQSSPMSVHCVIYMVSPFAHILRPNSQSHSISTSPPRAIVEHRVKAALRRDTPDWRLRNACPSCLYKLEGEPHLEILLLCTKDGNNSLKRFEKLERRKGKKVPGPSKEREETRKVDSDYILPCEDINRWGKKGVDEMMKGFVPDEEWTDEPDGCSERWENMKEAVTGKAWAMYDETGIFLLLCRHGFVLLVADMVHSGEMGKYGFAVVNHLVSVLGEIGDGYDIGCKFGKMVNSHPVLGPRTRANNYCSLVVLSMGTDTTVSANYATWRHMCRASDWSLLKAVKSSSQSPTHLPPPFDMASLGLSATKSASHSLSFMGAGDSVIHFVGDAAILVKKYKHALEVQATAPALEEAMRQLGIASKDEFVRWHTAEKAALEGLLHEPPVETMSMEYYQKLVNLAELKQQLDIIFAMEASSASSSGDSYTADTARTQQMETQRRHALERYERTLEAVQDLERRLEVTTRWVPGMEAWNSAAVWVKKRRYQWALDQLQALIISRMFELTKMNMLGTGYKPPKHIAKALQARSGAVCTALQKYNEAAANLKVPREALTWEEVVNYSFLAEFDLLRDGRDDVRTYPWTKLSGRVAMDQYYKLERAAKEITHLNIEIRRLVTHICDEEVFLQREEARVREECGEALAHQVYHYRMERGHSDGNHIMHLTALTKLPGFTGTEHLDIRTTESEGAETLGAPSAAPAHSTPLGVLSIDDDAAEQEEDKVEESVEAQFCSTYTHRRHGPEPYRIGL
ncbi:hypothetical protein B0H14DRAFT_2587736 [Mycena olivaceomarginata]|nr:hypothetical protein B0H14DRAFT_2587736 [Mycena olivaceomarginata]